MQTHSIHLLTLSLFCHAGVFHVVLQQLVLVDFTLASTATDNMAAVDAPSTTTAATATEHNPTTATAAAAAGHQVCGPPLLWPQELLPLPPCSTTNTSSSRHSSSSGTQWRLSMTDVRILVPPQQLAALLPLFQGLGGVYTVGHTPLGMDGMVAC
jgi:hypothetical protein